MDIRSMTPRTVSIKTPAGAVSLSVSIGEVIIITGPNGSGKSSLLHYIARDLGGNGDVETFSGHRQIHFASDDVDTIGMSIDQLRTQMTQHPSHFGRTRGAWGEQHLKSVVRRLVNRQNQDNNDLMDLAESTGQTVKTISETRPRTLSVLNDIFRAGRLAVELFFHDGVLKARRNGNIYGIDSLSDGERAALLVVGAILIRSAGSVVLIDEPERHLNPKIAGPLISAAVAARPDISFIFASHELSLIEALRANTILHVQSSSVIGSGDLEMRTYDMQIIIDDENISEDLRCSVLGSRRAVLFVEGETFSDDQALYSRLYPDHYIIPRGNADNVIASTRALRVSNQFHWLEAEAVIDGDGREPDEKVDLRRSGVYPLMVPTIENLFLHPLILKQMADALSEFIGGQTGPERFATAKRKFESALVLEKTNILARRLVWVVNRELSARKISVRTALQTNTIESVDVCDLRNKQELWFMEMCRKYRGLRIISRMPIKNTSLPAILAESLGYENFKTYKRAVLRHLQFDSQRSRKIHRTFQRLSPQITHS